MKTVILAGGKGTRVASLGFDLPKPLLPVAGKPVLERQISVLHRQGFDDIILVIGYLGDRIRDYFGDGSSFGVRITYVTEKEPLGTAGSLSLLRETLVGDDFLLLCGDLVFDVDLQRFYAYHKEKGGTATVLTHPNTHPADSVLVDADENGRALAFLPPCETRGSVGNRVNAGLHFFSDRVLPRFPQVKKTDLDREVLLPLCREGELYVYNSPEYVRDMGTPARFTQVARDIEKGIVAAGNLARPQKAFFLDRDGTVNRYCGFLSDPSDLVLCDGAAKAVRMLNERGYPVIIVTNQPVVARGELTVSELTAIHHKLESLLGDAGAYVNDIYYCPHHPDRGFPGEIPDLKIHCDCRKPAPGMLLRAAQRYHIDLSASYMIGDRENDIEAGRRAGCRTALIGQGVPADFRGDSLLSCVRQILDSEGEKA